MLILDVFQNKKDTTAKMVSFFYFTGVNHHHQKLCQAEILNTY